MKITYYTHKPEDCKSRKVVIGQKLVGIRLLSFEIESSQELEELLSEQGVKWAKQHLRFGYIHQPIHTKTLGINHESNWGSDWVDDGV